MKLSSHDRAPQATLRQPLALLAEPKRRKLCPCLGRMSRRRFLALAAGACAGCLSGQVAFAQTNDEEFFFRRFPRAKFLVDVVGTVGREQRDTCELLDEVEISGRARAGYRTTIQSGSLWNIAEVCAATRQLPPARRDLLQRSELGRNLLQQCANCPPPRPSGASSSSAAWAKGAAMIAGAAGAATGSLAESSASPSQTDDNPSPSSDPDKAMSRCQAASDRYFGYENRAAAIYRSCQQRTDSLLPQLRQLDAALSPQIDELRMIHQDYTTTAFRLRSTLAFDNDVGRLIVKVAPAGMMAAVFYPFIHHLEAATIGKVITTAPGQLGVGITMYFVEQVMAAVRWVQEKSTEKLIRPFIDDEALQSTKALHELLEKYRSLLERLNAAKKKYYKDHDERRQFANKIYQDTNLTNQKLAALFDEAQAAWELLESGACPRMIADGSFNGSPQRYEVPQPPELKDPLPEALDESGTVFEA